MKTFKRLFLLSTIVVILIGAVVYQKIFFSNVDLGNKEYYVLTIPTNSTLDDLVEILKKDKVLKNATDFKWTAYLKSFKKVKPGRYYVYNKSSNNSLINMLRIGDQKPVFLTFNNVRNLNQLAGKISRQIELDSLTLSRVLNQPEVQKKYGFNAQTFISMFIANTYEVFWNISAEALIKRMATEYKSFWNSTRKAKAKQLGLSQSQVATLASIVAMESSKPDEYAKIAGVYINRLKKGIPLQADPTIIFALNDYSIKRVLKKHLEIDSPYNTYKYKGLPPGAIYLTQPRLLDAVLNYQVHPYYYFCAKPDFSGYHQFARTYSEHLKNARTYQKALNRKKIYK